MFNTKNLFTIVLFIGFSRLAFSQLSNATPEYADYDWKQSPQLTNINVADTNVSEYILKHKKSIEFIKVGNKHFEYRLTHKKIKLLTHRGIEENNKIYIPVENNEIVFQKARVITSEGKVQLLSADDIKEGVDPDYGRAYKYFAFEGIDINAEIEYIYYLKTSSSFQGQTVTMQRIAPQLDVDCEIIHPTYLEFEFHSINGFPKMGFKTNKNSKKSYSVHLDSLSGVLEVEKSNTDAYKQRLLFHLKENTYLNQTDVYSYSNFSRWRFNRMYNQLGATEKTIIRKLYKDIDIDMTSTESKVRSIDNYLKENYRYVGGWLDDKIGDLYESKVLSEFYFQFLTVNLLKKAGVNHKLVYTSLRTELPFEKEYENLMYLQEALIYIPDLNLYYSLNPSSRLGFPNYKTVNNYGLFIRKRKYSQSVYYGSGKVKFIPAPDYTKSSDTILTKMDIADGFYDSELTLTRKIGGYPARFLQPSYHLIDNEKDQVEFKKELIEYIDDEGEITEYSVDNLNPSDYGVVPVVVKAKLTTSTFFEKAKDNFMFKVGKLIGPQTELYAANEKERTLPVDDYYPRNFYREIEFNIPDGFEVKNLTDLIFFETLKNEEGEVLISFKSFYKVEGNTVKVKIEEFYTQTQYPASDFKMYRRIVNVAADFEKINLVFEKIK